MQFTIRKYKNDGWQIWNTDRSPFSGDIIGESDKFFIVALGRFLLNLIFNKREW
jgi:hypothetical protein